MPNFIRGYIIPDLSKKRSNIYWTPKLHKSYQSMAYICCTLAFFETTFGSCFRYIKASIQPSRAL